MKSVFLMGMLALLCLLTGGVQAEEIAPGKTGTLAGLEHDRKETPAKLYVPSDYTPAKKWPLIISMHGLGGSPTVGPWNELLGGKGYLIAGLNYADVQLTPDGKWKGSYESSKMGDAIVRAYIRGAVEKIAASYRIDRDCILYAGSSMGGWNIGTFGCTQDMADFFRGYIGWGCNPHKVGDTNFALAKGKPVMLYYGEKCFVKPMAEPNLKFLTAGGINLTYKVYPGESHGVKSSVCRESVVKWFDEIQQEDHLLKGDPVKSWRSGTLSGAPSDKTPATLAAYFKQQAFGKDRPEGKPQLLWLYADETVLQKGKPAVRSRSSLKTDKIQDTLFQYPDAVDTLVACEWFDCVAINLSGIERKTNAVFNDETAPQLLLIARDGETVVVVDPTQPDKAVGAKMLGLLDEAQKTAATARIAAFAGVRTQWNELAKTYSRNQDKLVKGFVAGLQHDDKQQLALKEEQSRVLQQFVKLRQDWDAAAGK